MQLKDSLMRSNAAGQQLTFIIMEKWIGCVETEIEKVQRRREESGGLRGSGKDCISCRERKRDRTAHGSSRHELGENLNSYKMSDN